MPKITTTDLATILLGTEHSGNPETIYKVNFAVPNSLLGTFKGGNNSGFSFGIVQLDIGVNGFAQAAYTDILNDALGDGVINDTQYDRLIQYRDNSRYDLDDTLKLTYQADLQLLNDTVFTRQNSLDIVDQYNDQYLEQSLLGKVQVFLDEMVETWGAESVFDHNHPDYHLAVSAITSLANRTGNLNAETAALKATQPTSIAQVQSVFNDNLPPQDWALVQIGANLFSASDIRYEGVTNTISFADAADDFGVADGSDVAELYLESIFGAAISNVTYTGSDDAAFLVSDFVIPGVDIDLEGGILLSSGDFPGSSNTSSGFTIEHGTAGDSDLLDVVQAAFPAAGVTQDASVLQFDIFIEDSNVDGLRFDIVFGSEEYSEFSNSNFVDVAAVWIDENRNGVFEVGENKALFNGNRNTPLSVIDENLALNFVDNEGVLDEFGNFEGAPYAIEWDGFGALAVRLVLQEGLNSIKIAVADTGDQALDSAIYVTNLELLTGGATGNDVFVVVNGAVGQNNLEASATSQEFNLVEGLGSVYGALMELNGDVITGFDALKELIFNEINFLREQLSAFSGSAILEVDSDQDGTADSTVTLEGDFSDGDFMAVADGSNTVVTFETFLT
jgi:hypothetical protein